MHRRVASRTPASATAQESGVWRLADEDFASGQMGLRMAFQAEVVIPLHQHLVVNRSMRRVANRATFSQRLVFKDGHFCLFSMTRGAVFILSCEAHPPCCLEDFRAVRIVTINAVHLLLKNGMMLREAEFCVCTEMAIKASRGVLAGIDDEPATTTTSLDMLTARTVAGLTPDAAGGVFNTDIQSRVRTVMENAGIIRMALSTGFISNKRCTFNFRRREDGTGKRSRTRTGNESHRPKNSEHHQSQKTAPAMAKPLEQLHV
jgi:hypothetical protein